MGDDPDVVALGQVPGPVPGEAGLRPQVGGAGMADQQDPEPSGRARPDVRYFWHSRVHKAPGGAAFASTRSRDRIVASPRARREDPQKAVPRDRSEEHTSELQSLMRLSYAV